MLMLCPNFWSMQVFEQLSYDQKKYKISFLLPEFLQFHQKSIHNGIHSCFANVSHTTHCFLKKRYLNNRRSIPVVSLLIKCHEWVLVC